VYIGAAGEQLSNLCIRFRRNAWWTFSRPEADPATSPRSLRRHSLAVDKFLMRRYFVVEKLRSSKIIGLVAGTLAVDGFREAMDRAKRLVRRSGRKAYSFVVGKLNVPKLANFMEIDCFVLVAAPEYSFLAGSESREFAKPLATPFELEVAFDPETRWSGEYVTDFRALLGREEGGCGSPVPPSSLGADAGQRAGGAIAAAAAAARGAGEEESSVDRAGEDRGAAVDDEQGRRATPSAERTAPRPRGAAARRAAESSALVAFGTRSMVEFKSPAGDFLQGRGYTGLEARVGETEVASIIDGQHGIASCLNGQ
jgi:diphthamide biosynthesis protein 2